MHTHHRGPLPSSSLSSALLSLVPAKYLRDDIINYVHSMKKTFALMPLIANKSSKSILRDCRKNHNHHHNLDCNQHHNHNHNVNVNVVLNVTTCEELAQPKLHPVKKIIIAIMIIFIITIMIAITITIMIVIIITIMNTA